MIISSDIFFKEKKSYLKWVRYKMCNQTPQKGRNNCMGLWDSLIVLLLARVVLLSAQRWQCARNDWYLEKDSKWLTFLSCSWDRCFPPVWTPAPEQPVSDLLWERPSRRENQQICVSGLRWNDYVGLPLLLIRIQYSYQHLHSFQI